VIRDMVDVDPTAPIPSDHVNYINFMITLYEIAITLTGAAAFTVTGSCALSF